LQTAGSFLPLSMSCLIGLRISLLILSDMRAFVAQSTIAVVPLNLAKPRLLA
jgi:hypothetical protein